MKFNKKVGLLLFVFSIIVTSCIFSGYIEFNINTNLKEERKEVNEIENKYTQKPADFWPDEPPIFINGTAVGPGANNWTWAVNQDWCDLVNGVYVIENVTINAYNYSYGIWILNSNNVYFRINNCTVCHSAGDGILLECVANGTLTNNYCYDNDDYGIDMILCKNNTIISNYIYGNTRDGLRLEWCNNNTVSHNEIYNNDEDGINIGANGPLYHNYNNITNNKIHDNGDNGIHIDLKSSGGISNFTNNNISYNRIYANGISGIYFDTWTENNGKINVNYNIISRNNITNHMGTWNGIGIYIEAELWEDGQVNFDHNQIVGNNITDVLNAGILIDFELNPSCTINARGSSSFNNISNNNIKRTGFYGISYLIHDEIGANGNLVIKNNTIARNFIYNFGFIGIDATTSMSYGSSAKTYCNNNTIIANYITRTTSTIEVNFGIYLSDFTNTTLLQNEMINCGLFMPPPIELGVLLSQKIDNSNLVNNKQLIYKSNEENLKLNDFMNTGQVILVNCNDSIISNINVSRATLGISIYYCENITIYNITSSRGICGIYALYSIGNNISTNFANDNSNYGIVLYHTNNSLIINNDLRRNPICILEINCQGNTIANNICDLPTTAPFPRDNGNGDKEKKENSLIIIIIFLMIVGSAIVITATSLYHYRSRNKTAKSIIKTRVKESDGISHSFPASEEILMKLTNKILLLQLFQTKKLKKLNNQLEHIDLTAVSKEFLKKLDSIQVDIEEKREFLKEMLLFSPIERNEILDNIIKRLNSYSEGK